ncbi:MAG: hypothetical protein HZA48_10725 [Planctomycetes bacterium]|nr:hypothetical protein [Planctomycetota bacterium]
MFDKQRWSLYIIIAICSIAAYFAYNKMINSKKAQIVFSSDHSFVMVYRAMDDDSEKTQHNVISRLHGVATSKNGIPADGIKMYYITGETLTNDFINKNKQFTKNDFKIAQMVPGNADYFIATLESMERGRKYYYFIEAVDNAGNTITLPEKPLEGHRNLFRLSYENKAALQSVLLIHIVTMLIALFFLIHSFYYSIHFLIVGAKGIISKCFSTVFWGTVFFTVSGFPIGWWVAYDSVGSAWGGFPLGNDITDNKTLVTFLFWAIVLFLMPKTLFNRQTGKDYIGEKAFAVLTILGSILTLVVFLVIPHSY